MCFLNFGKTSAAVDELRAKITESESPLPMGNQHGISGMIESSLQRQIFSKSVSLAIVIFMDSNSHGHLAESISDMFQDQELQKHETIDALSKLAQTMEQFAHSQSG